MTPAYLWVGPTRGIKPGPDRKCTPACLAAGFGLCEYICSERSVLEQSIRAIQPRTIFGITACSSVPAIASNCPPPSRRRQKVCTTKHCHHTKTGGLGACSALRPWETLLCERWTLAHTDDCRQSCATPNPAI